MGDIYTLEYLWVRKYQCLQNFGVNFSERYHFEFDEESGILSEKNTREANSFIDDVFGTDFEVSALVGNNGAGKTTLLKFIFSLCRGNGGSESGFVAVYRNHKRNKLQVVYKSVTINSMPEGVVFDEANINNDVDYIYYSNCVAKFADEWQGGYNISQARMLLEAEETKRNNED